MEFQSYSTKDGIILDLPILLNILSHIVFQFDSLDTEADRDLVEVWVGGSTFSSASLLTAVSGDTAPTYVHQSFNNFMIVKFVSDSTTEFQGFTAKWNVGE